MPYAGGGRALPCTCHFFEKKWSKSFITAAAGLGTAITVYTYCPARHKDGGRGWAAAAFFSRVCFWVLFLIVQKFSFGALILVSAPLLQHALNRHPVSLIFYEWISICLLYSKFLRPAFLSPYLRCFHHMVSRQILRVPLFVLSQILLLYPMERLRMLRLFQGFHELFHHIQICQPKKSSFLNLAFLILSISCVGVIVT